MKKFFAFLVLFAMALGSGASAQTYSRQQARTQGVKMWQGFGQDAKERIRLGCADKMKNARAQRNTELEWLCKLSSIRQEEADLGPWKKLVYALVKIFNQLRRLIYVGAVFMLLWIFVKGMYEGEAKWMQLGMLIIGVTMVSFAEVFVDIATNKTNLDDIKNGDIFVDCRAPDEGLYICAPDIEGSEDHDMRYVFQVSKGADTNSAYRGLY
jgi:hypothetical protein